jgi:hypothetical protein
MLRDIKVIRLPVGTTASLKPDKSLDLDVCSKRSWDEPVHTTSDLNSSYTSLK